MKMEVREAREEETEALSEIRVRSKGHWGYSRETLEAWRPAMAVTINYLRGAIVRSILVDDRLVGFYALKKEEGILDHLWLVPEAIGKGVGRFAFAHAASVARDLGLSTLLIISDADAAGFYLKMGAQKVGEHYSPLQNRMLPKLLFHIPEESPPATDSDPSGVMARWRKKMREPLRLPADVEEKTMRMEEYSHGAIIVSLILRDGRKISNAVMAGGVFLAWVGEREIQKEEELDFSLDDVVDAEEQFGYV
jgi:GNAT superfamily N-acetyltransferase